MTERRSGSLLPVFMSISTVLLFIGLVNWAHGSSFGVYMFITGVLGIISGVLFWLSLLLWAKISLGSGSYRLVKSGCYLTIFVTVMFIFCYLMIPLFHWMCHNLDMRGNASHSSESFVIDSDASHVVDVQVLANKNAYLPWEFKALNTAIVTKSGSNLSVVLFIKNNSDDTIKVRPKFIVSPAAAAKYLHSDSATLADFYTLSAAESDIIRLNFIISPQLPAAIKDISLSFTLFDTANVGKQLPRGGGFYPVK